MKNEISLKELLPEITESDITEGKLRHQISKAIRAKRKELNMTQKDFAKYMDVSQTMISKWESFSYNFTPDDIAQIFTKLDMDVSFHISNL